MISRPRRALVSTSTPRARSKQAAASKHRHYHKGLSGFVRVISSPLPDVARSQYLVCVCVRAVAEAVGAAAPFIKLDGKLPAFVMVMLDEGPADHIRKQAYKYAKLLKSNSNMSARIKETQAQRSPP